MKQIGDISSWDAGDIASLFEEMDRLRSIARQEGWEDEFISNVREWSDAEGEYPIEWLKMRRHDWSK